MTHRYPWPIIGNDRALLQLEKDLSNEALAHMYLLSGPTDLGKYRVALMCAQIMQCPDNFCQSCPTCHQIYQGTHPDTMIMRDDGSKIKISEIRSLISRVNITSNSRYTIIIIENVERMTTEAANSFLKTLEEPPADTYFFFTTNNWRNLLPTLVSRSRLVNFHLPPAADVTRVLHDEFPHYEERSLDAIINFSMFSPERARRLLSSPDECTHAEQFYHEMVKLYEKQDLLEGFRFVETISADVDRVHQFIMVSLYILRSMLLDVVQGKHSPLSSHQCIALMKYLEKSERLLQSNISVKLLLENFIFQLCDPHTS